MPESEADTRGEAERGLPLPEHVAYLRPEAGEHHACRVGVLHVDAAQHHQEAGTVFGCLVEQVFRTGYAGVDGERQVRGVLVQDAYLRVVDGFVLDFVKLAVGSACTYLYLLGEHAVLDNDAAVGAEGDLFL